MAMDSIKFRSVHLMDDGDGHHNFGIDGDGDGHHFKGDGRHVWSQLISRFFWYFFVNFEAVIVLKSKQSNCHSLLQFRTIGTKKKIHIVS